MTLVKTTNEIDQVVYQLKHESVALTGKKKNQPVIVYRHKHWHLISLGFLVNEKMHSKRGISNINFMSSSRARKYITEELNFCKIVPFTQVLPHFEDELAAKVLPSAEDYRSLLQQEWVVIAGGFTTDTLQESSIKKNNNENLISQLNEIIKKGPMGLFLHFEKYFTAFIQD